MRSGAMGETLFPNIESRYAPRTDRRAHQTQHAPLRCASLRLTHAPTSPKPGPMASRPAPTGNVGGFCCPGDSYRPQTPHLVAPAVPGASVAAAPRPPNTRRPVPGPRRSRYRPPVPTLIMATHPTGPSASETTKPRKPSPRRPPGAAVPSPRRSQAPGGRKPPAAASPRRPQAPGGRKPPAAASPGGRKPPADRKPPASASPGRQSPRAPVSRWPGGCRGRRSAALRGRP